jgi:hypothetical protein
LKKGFQIAAAEKSERDEVIAETAAGNLLLLKNCFELLLANDAFG